MPSTTRIVSMIAHGTSEDLGKLQNLESLRQLVSCHSVLTSGYVSFVLAPLSSYAGSTKHLHTKLIA